MPKQLVIGGLSGSGKDTVRNLLLERGVVRRGVTCTTRPRRPGEVNSYDFYPLWWFWVLKLFGRMAESTVYIGNPVAYGITWRRIREAKASTIPTCWILDSVGVERMRELFPGEVVSVYLYASILSLAERMEKRGEDNETILRRLKRYEEEKELGLRHFGCAVNTTNLTPGKVAGQIISLLKCLA